MRGRVVLGDLARRRPAKLAEHVSGGPRGTLPPPIYLSGETGRQPIFAGFPDIDLELVGTDVLDGRLVALEYRPATAD